MLMSFFASLINWAHAPNGIWFKMHTLSHPNVMSLTGVCLDTGGGPAVVMPYMGNGSVLQYLKKERGKLVPPDDADCSVV